MALRFRPTPPQFRTSILLFPRWAAHSCLLCQVYAHCVLNCHCMRVIDRFSRECPQPTSVLLIRTSRPTCANQDDWAFVTPRRSIGEFYSHSQTTQLNTKAISWHRSEGFILPYTVKSIFGPRAILIWEGDRDMVVPRTNRFLQGLSYASFLVLSTW